MKVYDNDNTEKQLLDYARKIDNAIFEFCHMDAYGSDGLNMTTATTLQWNACLMYIYNAVFKTTWGNNIDYDNGILLQGVVDLYVYRCGIYNKIPSPTGFAFMVGMSAETVQTWNVGYKFKASQGTEVREVSAAKQATVKYLSRLHERGLLAKLEDSKSPVGQIAAGNVVHNWDNRRVSENVQALQINTQDMTMRYLTDSSDIKKDQVSPDTFDLLEDTSN